MAKKENLPAATRDGRLASFLFRAALAASLAAAVLAGCSSSPVKIVSPESGVPVPTLSEGQKAYLTMPRKERVAYFGNQKSRDKMKALGYYPLPTRIAWTYSGDTNAATAFDVRVTQGGRTILSTNLTETSLFIDNLEIARAYDVVVSCAAGEAKSRFTTEDFAPRLIRVPGVPNVRDLGGRIGRDGRRIRQGRVYRSAGLNDNASKVYYTLDELLEKHPERKAESDALLAEISEWNAREAASNDQKRVAASFSAEWTLFLPTNGIVSASLDIEKQKTARLAFRDAVAAALAPLGAVPDSFMGAAGAAKALPAGKTVSFGPANQSTPAVLMQTVVAPEDGLAALSAGGDYWWCVLANGEVVFDLLAAGNWRTPYTPACYGVPVPLHKGTNLVAVVLYGGAASWSWGWKDGAKLPTDRVCHDKARSLEKIREGMFGKVEKAKVPGKNRLNDATRDYLTRVLGIRSDIDLRRDDECYGMKGSPLGDGATWFHYSSKAYGTMQSDEGKTAFTKVFKVFLDEKNYPIDFHCIAGQDRTGAVAFILGALLGMAEEDLYLDWETTGFWNGSANFCHARLFNHLVAGFDKWPGETVNERVEAYVLSLGFTPDDIAKFRGMMLE